MQLDDDDDLPGDISALVVVRKQLERDEATGQAFKKAWCAFEASACMFFERMDACYRTELQVPLLGSIEPNLEKLRQVCSPHSAPSTLTVALEVLEAIRQTVVGGPLQWSGHSVFHEKGSSKTYFRVHDKNVFIPVEALPHLTDQCTRAHNILEQEYKLYREYEIDLQLLVLLWNQRSHLTKQSHQAALRAYSILCDIYAANLKLDSKMGVGFVTGEKGKGMDVQFKMEPSTCRCYDLMASTKSTLSSAVIELREPLHEMIEMIRARHGK